MSLEIYSANITIHASKQITATATIKKKFAQPKSGALSSWPLRWRFHEIRPVAIVAYPPPFCSFL